MIYSYFNCPDCPNCEDTVVAECNCPAQIATDSDVCTKLSEQLDRIEKKISWTTEKTEEDLFEEFKTWYENK